MIEPDTHKVEVAGLAALRRYEERVLSARDIQYNTGGHRTMYWIYGWKSIMTFVFTKFKRLESALRRLDEALAIKPYDDALVNSILDDIMEACADGRNYLAFQYEEALLHAEAAIPPSPAIPYDTYDDSQINSILDAIACNTLDSYD